MSHVQNPTPAVDSFAAYRDREPEEDKVIATYVWIDGSGQNLRQKSRVLDSKPKKPEGDTLENLITSLT